MSSQSYFAEEQQLMAQTAQALSLTVRVAIQPLLSSQTCCNHDDMAEELNVARSTLSQHLTVLKEAGLIQGDIQPPKIKYCIHRDNDQKALGFFLNFFNLKSDSGFSPEGVILCTAKKTSINVSNELIQQKKFR
jgi:DNA-binding transcriptional ArsR family regulator